MSDSLSPASLTWSHELDPGYKKKSTGRSLGDLSISGLTSGVIEIFHMTRLPLLGDGKLGIPGGRIDRMMAR